MENANQAKIDELNEYLVAIKKKRIELMTGAQSYSIGSRSLARYNITLKELNLEIARVEDEIATLEGNRRVRMKKAIYHDFA